MTKLLAGKVSTFLAALTTSLILSGCETTDGKPEICQPGTNCAKAKVVKKAPATKRSGGQSDSSRGGSRSNY